MLAVEALEREVNNGGYEPLFVNSSREFAPEGDRSTWHIRPQINAIDAVICTRDEKRAAKLNRCDDSYYKSAEPIAGRLFAFIKANRASISLRRERRWTPAGVQIASLFAPPSTRRQIGSVWPPTPGRSSRASLVYVSVTTGIASMNLRAPRFYWDGAGPWVLVMVKAKEKRPPKVRRVPFVLEEP